MKVLVVSQYFWPEGFRINDVVRTLVEKGIEVDVLTGKPNYPEGTIFQGYRAAGTQVESWGGAAVLRVPLFPRGARGAWRLALNYLSFVAAGTIFGPWLLRKRQYDAVSSMGLRRPYCKPFRQSTSDGLKDAPWCCGCRTSGPTVWLPQATSATPAYCDWLNGGVRWIYRHTDLLLVQSRAFQAPVAALAPGRPIA